jgi:RNA 2',3'-cyclic 3'-phosphodiesterase
MPKKPKPNKLRCFVGLKYSLLEQLQPLIDDLKACANDENNKLRITPPQNLHITLKFLGSANKDQLPSIKLLLGELASKYHSFELQCRGIGIFKNSIWVGIEPEDYLTSIASELNDSFASLGFNAEQKPYIPHVTLARFGQQAKIGLSAMQEKYVGKQWGNIKVEKFYLYKSDTIPEGARYTILKGFKFDSGAIASKPETP